MHRRGDYQGQDKQPAHDPGCGAPTASGGRQQRARDIRVVCGQCDHVFSVALRALVVVSLRTSFNYDHRRPPQTRGRYGRVSVGAAGAHQACLVGEHNKLGPVAGTEFGHGPRDVGLGR
jgi:hypothetical protein